jgi:NADH-quinone oxidoreductase subunit H
MFMWVRWTVPRFRYDQVMHLGWKVMLPAALVFITTTASTILVLESMGFRYGLVYGLILTAVNGLVAAGFFWVLDRDRVMSGSYAADRERILRERQVADSHLVLREDVSTAPRRSKETAGV